MESVENMILGGSGVGTSQTWSQTPAAAGPTDSIVDVCRSPQFDRKAVIQMIPFSQHYAGGTEAGSDGVAEDGNEPHGGLHNLGE